MSKKKVTITEPPTKQSVAEVAIPNGFKHTQFEECLYSASQSHKDGVDLWLFQLPEEMTAEQFATQNIEIPLTPTVSGFPASAYIPSDRDKKRSGTDEAEDIDPEDEAEPSMRGILAATAANRSSSSSESKGTEGHEDLPANHRIADFMFNGVKYVLSEVSPLLTGSMVNLWTSDDEETLQKGLVNAGKPFRRYFKVTADIITHRAMYATHPISAIQMGHNESYTPGYRHNHSNLSRVSGPIGAKGTVGDVRQGKSKKEKKEKLQSQHQQQQQQRQQESKDIVMVEVGKKRKFEGDPTEDNIKMKVGRGNDDESVSTSRVTPNEAAKTTGGQVDTQETQDKSTKKEKKDKKDKKEKKEKKEKNQVES